MSDSDEISQRPEILDGVTKQDVFRDAVVFQFKLVVDGIRDFVLIPVSLIATALSLLRSGSRPGTEFYEVVAFGRRTEKQINLFSAADRLGPEPGPGDDVGPDLDSFVDDIEAYVRREASGGRFDAARERIERALGMRQRGGDGAGSPQDDGADGAHATDAERGRGDGGA